MAAEERSIDWRQIAAWAVLLIVSVFAHAYVEALNEARRVLKDNRDVLERVTRFLLEKEVMEGDELRAMMNAPRAVNL